MGEDLWAVASSAAITAIHRDPAGAAMAPRDPEATKAKLLAAARREFADKGIAGARVDAIAERAGVNKQLIYYYFGTKEDLFREILRERLARPGCPDAEDSRTTGARLAAVAARLPGRPRLRAPPDVGGPGGRADGSVRPRTSGASGTRR